MDLQVWSRLTPSDIGFVCEVITALPRMLINLRDEKISISRAWQVWIEFAAKALGIVNESRKTAPNKVIASNLGAKEDIEKEVGVLKYVDQVADISENKKEIKNSVKNKPVKKIVITPAKKRSQK